MWHEQRKQQRTAQHATFLPPELLASCKSAPCILALCNSSLANAKPTAQAANLQTGQSGLRATPGSSCRCVPSCRSAPVGALNQQKTFTRSQRTRGTACHSSGCCLLGMHALEDGRSTRHPVTHSSSPRHPALPTVRVRPAIGSCPTICTATYLLTPADANTPAHRARQAGDRLLPHHLNRQRLPVGQPAKHAVQAGLRGTWQMAGTCVLHSRNRQLWRHAGLIQHETASRGVQLAATIAFAPDATCLNCEAAAARKRLHATHPTAILATLLVADLHTGRQNKQNNHLLPGRCPLMPVHAPRSSCRQPEHAHQPGPGQQLDHQIVQEHTCES